MGSQVPFLLSKHIFLPFIESLGILEELFLDILSLILLDVTKDYTNLNCWVLILVSSLFSPLPPSSPYKQGWRQRITGICLFEKSIFILEGMSQLCPDIWILELFSSMADFWIFVGFPQYDILQNVKVIKGLCRLYYDREQ